MLQFQKRYLLLSSVLCLSFVSCRISNYKSIKNCDTITLSEQQLKPVIEKSSASKYKTSIDILNKHLSGIVIVKQTDSVTSHVIFVTELGMKMFDFEMKDSTMKAVYVFEPLNKANLIQTLTQNFKNIFLLNIFNKQVNSCKNKKSLPVFRYSYHKERYFYTTDSLGVLYLQEKFNKRKKESKITYKYDFQAKQYAEIKSIQYGIIKIKIELQKIYD